MNQEPLPMESCEPSAPKAFGVAATILHPESTNDGMGRRISTMPGGQSEGFGYDLDGNQLYETNFNGAIITNLYDSMNRLTNVSSLFGYNVSYAYSATGQRTNMVDPSGTTAYAYDLRDRLVQKAEQWTGGPAISLNYLYDLNGNLTNLWSNTSGGATNVYQYDALNRLTNVIGQSGSLAQYRYDLAGNLQSMRYGNGVTNLFQYDGLNRLTNSLWNSNALTLCSFSYQLGATGNRTNLNETVAGTNRIYSWQYDHLYRLTNESIGSIGSLGYAFDPVGNRTTRTVSGLSLTNQSFTYNTNDWLSTDKYDRNGNTTNSSNNVYQYDMMNHLTNAWVNGVQVLMTYDGDGDRVSKTVGTVTTYYLLDSQNPSGYSQVLEEWTNTAMARVYNYGLDLINQRQPGISTNCFIFDGHGSTRMLTDIGGTVVNVLVYDAYGNLIASNGAPQTAYLYSGQQWDPDLDLYLNRARYLNPNTGRFWTMDGDYGNNEDPLSLHKYLYAECDPVNNDDPSGNASLMSMILAPLDPIFAAIYSSPSGPKPAVGSLAPNISLSTTEPALILERLFLAEVRSPQNANFSLSEAVTSIHAMGSVIYDRCEANWLGYKHLGYPKDPLHVVTQAGQFQGFQGYTQGAPNGNLPSKIVTRINGELNGANNGADPHYQSYFVIVSEAISTAQNVISGKIYYEDPFKPIRPFGWMGSYAKRGPGGRFYPIGTLAGNTFYGIR